MQDRLKKHFDTNNARALTKEQKREKKIKKTKEDLSHGVEIAIYLIKDCSSAATRWKLKENAKQLYMTGFLLTTSDHCILVVEGGPKSQRKLENILKKFTRIHRKFIFS